jgi:eukaryotic-like serine/threonine-protein kinase
MQNILTWLHPLFPDLSNLTPLSRGGQKLVFSATHATDGDVVLKIIQPTQDIEVTRREILAVDQVQCERVPKILDVGIVPTPMGDCVWLREQRVMGNPVRVPLSQGPLALGQLLKLGLHTLEALAKAEEVHIVHRDVKPENIMVDGKGDYWLLDFGLARHLELVSLTATGPLGGKGTAGYAPPEQIHNLKPDIDGRTDLFGLGITLYECATGTNPFRDGARDQYEVLQRTERLILPSINLPFASANKFRDLVDAMTQKRRDHRPANVRAALEWMQEIYAAENLI